MHKLYPSIVLQHVMQLLFLFLVHKELMCVFQIEDMTLCCLKNRSLWFNIDEQM